MKNKILLFISLIVVSCTIKIHHDITAISVNGEDFYQIQCPYSTALHDPRFELPQEATCLTYYLILQLHAWVASRLGFPIISPYA